MLRSTATKRALWSLERRLAGLRIETAASSSVSYFSSEAAAPAAKKPFPSNLFISPRSSFAPRKVPKFAPEPEEESDEEEQEEKQASEAASVEEQEEEEEDSDYYDSDNDKEEEEFQWEAPPKLPVIPLPDRLHVPIYNFGSSHLEPAGTIWLDKDLFGRDPIRVDFLKRAVDFYRNKKRGRRKAKTKTISEIRGSKRKQRPQKGGGVARAGHKKVPHWRGGAKAHGPKNTTDYGNTKLNKKVRRQAVQHVLAAKLKQRQLILVNQFHSLPTHKTKELAEWLKPFRIGGRHGTSGLLIDHYFPDQDEGEGATSYRGVPVNLTVASGNLKKVKVGNQLHNINVYDVLKYEKLVLTVDALTAIEERLKD